jgi:hypothetical protein
MMKRRNVLTVRSFFRVWTLYGAIFSGAVGSAVLIGSTAFFSVLELLRSHLPQLNAVFRGDGILSSFEKAMSNGLEYLGVSLVLLLIIWILLALGTFIPATVVGLTYEVLNKYLRSEKVVLIVTYGLAALFGIAYGVLAAGWHFDGIPFLNVPLGLVTGLIACNITLRFRSDVLELKQASSAATA